MVRPASVDSNGMKKGAWSEEEDNKLRAYIQRYGHWNWRLLPKYAGLARCGKSCRLRWVNYLKPGVKRGNFTKHEENLIIELHAQLGNKWSAIASKLPGRTDNEIKNFWHTRVGKRLKRNPTGKKVKRHTNEASPKGQVSDQQEEQPTCKFITICETTGNESASLDATFLTKTQQPELSFDANTSLLSTTDPHEGDLWADYTSTLADNAYSSQNDYYLPLLPEEEFFYSKLHYKELSSSDSSYLSALDWIADDDHISTSSDYVAQSVQGDLWSVSFSSNASNSQCENSHVLPLEVGAVEGLDDPLLLYFDSWNEFV